MGFSLVAKGLFDTYLPDALWRPLLDNFGYTVGFLIVILGRQQLFTENTLTVILPLLTQRTMRTFLCVARLWGVVLATNLLGTLIFATVVAHVPIFSPEIQQSFLHVSQQSVTGAFGPTLLKGIFAGWLIALMVWLLPAADTTRLHIIIIITLYSWIRRILAHRRRFRRCILSRQPGENNLVGVFWQLHCSCTNWEYYWRSIARSRPQLCPGSLRDRGGIRHTIYLP